MTTKYYAKSVEGLDPETGVLLVRLMAAYEVLRCARQWFCDVSRRRAESQSVGSEDIVAFMTMCGWTREAALLIRGNSKGGFLEKPDDVKLQKVWDEVIGDERAGRFGICTRIRNKHIFHFDKKGAERVIGWIQQAPKDYPVCEATNDPETAARDAFSSYPWGREMLGAWASESKDINTARKEAPKNVEEVGGFALDLKKLLGAMIEQVMKKVGVELDTEG